MKVLMIGGSGTISTAVSRLMVEKGIDLYLLNRGKHAASVPTGAKVLIGDAKDVAATKQLLHGLTFDSVVDWIAFTPEDIQRDIELFQDRTQQFIFISSASAYQKPSTDYIITESTPLVNPYWDYSRNKIACEELLLKTYRNDGFPVTIVRPSYTYGTHNLPFVLNSSEHPYTFVDRLKRGQPILIPGDGTSLWVMTHNTDFAKGFVGLIGNQKSIGHAFHITSDEVMNWDQILMDYAAIIGVEPKIVHISSDHLCSLVPEWKGPLIGDKSASVVFDNSKIKRFVPGFIATVPFRQGVSESLAWFEDQADRRTVDNAFNQQIDGILAAFSGIGLSK